MSVDRRGFTLLELLLGLLIFSIIGTMVYSVFAIGVLVSQRSENRGAVFRDGRMALDLMARELESMVEYNASPEEETPGAFSGKKDEISFLLPTEFGLRQIRYFLREPSATRVYEMRIGERTARNVNLNLENRKADRLKYLVREERPFLKSPNQARTGEQSRPQQATTEQVILMSVQPDGLRFHFGFMEGETTPHYFWKESWDGQSGIPANVRVELSLVDVQEQDREFFLDLNILVPHGRQGADKKEAEKIGLSSDDEEHSKSFFKPEEF